MDRKYSIKDNNIIIQAQEHDLPFRLTMNLLKLSHVSERIPPGARFKNSPP